MVFVKKLNFFHLFELFPFFSIFLGKIEKKKVFRNILDRKNAFLDYRKRSKKKNKKPKTKNWHFSKGVSPWIWSKNGIFLLLFISGKIGKKKVFSDILERKNGFRDYENKE